MSKIHVNVTDQRNDHSDIQYISEAVFIAKQQTLSKLVWGADDAAAARSLDFEGEFSIDTAQLLPYNRIGRALILKAYHSLSRPES